MNTAANTATVAEQIAEYEYLIPLAVENLAKATKLGMRDVARMTRRDLRNYRAALAELKANN
jgi:hypothetical protein